MKAKEAAPQFSGIDAEGFLVFPNHYSCDHCASQVGFPNRVLADRYQAPFQSKLKLEDRNRLQPLVDTFLKKAGNRFALDFYCPQCKNAVAIGFEWREVRAGLVRYTPLYVFEGDE